MTESYVPNNTQSGLSREVKDRMYKEAASVLWRAGNEHPTVDQIMAMVKQLFIDPVVRDYVQDLLAPRTVAAYWEEFPPQAACGIAAADAASSDDKWSQRNVIAQYLTAAYGQEAYVDYHGVTIAQSSIDLVFSQDLVWVPLFLKACDTLMQGKETPRMISREWCLAFIDLIQAHSWEELLPYWEAFAGHALAESKRWTRSVVKTARPWLPADWWGTPGVLRQRLLIAWLFCKRLATFCVPTAASLLWHAERWVDYWLLSGDDPGACHQTDRLLYGLGALVTLDYLSKGEHEKLAVAWQALEAEGFLLEQAIDVLANATQHLACGISTPLEEQRLMRNLLFLSQGKQGEQP